MLDSIKRAPSTLLGSNIILKDDEKMERITAKLLE